MPSTIDVRLPEQLRERLMVTLQERRGQTLEQEIVRVLDGAVFGDTLEESLRVFDLPKVVRVRSSSTHADMRQVKSIIRATLTERIVLAAREDDLNNAVLVMAIATEERVFVLDRSMLNLARRPREMEIQELFQALDGRRLLESALFHPELIEDTREMPAEQAADVILRGSGVRALSDLSEYLQVLSQHGIFEEAKFRARRDGSNQAWHIPIGDDMCSSEL